jgi:hypoxia up-regulated 1
MAGPLRRIHCSRLVMMRCYLTLVVVLALSQNILRVAARRGILGLDLGSSYMKVALVQSGSPLQIVTNLHSKRKTEQMILFDNGQRLYGADANALMARKSHVTTVGMTLLLGRDITHPLAQVSSCM